MKLLPQIPAGQAAMCPMFRCGDCSKTGYIYGAPTMGAGKVKARELGWDDTLGFWVCASCKKKRDRVAEMMKERRATAPEPADDLESHINRRDVAEPAVSVGCLSCGKTVEVEYDPTLNEKRKWKAVRRALTDAGWLPVKEGVVDLIERAWFCDECNARADAEEAAAEATT